VVVCREPCRLVYSLDKYWPTAAVVVAVRLLPGDPLACLQGTHEGIIHRSRRGHGQINSWWSLGMFARDTWARKHGRCAHISLHLENVFFHDDIYTLYVRFTNKWNKSDYCITGAISHFHFSLSFGHQGSSGPLPFLISSLSFGRRGPFGPLQFLATVKINTKHQRKYIFMGRILNYLTGNKQQHLW
jgi:hypothetical protein